MFEYSMYISCSVIYVCTGKYVSCVNLTIFLSLKTVKRAFDKKIIIISCDIKLGAEREVAVAARPTILHFGFVFSE